MAFYDIDIDICLGMSHCGSVNTEGSSKVELSDEEVKTLVTLIGEKGTTDVEELGLEASHPDLYEKLDDAYYQLAYDTEEEYWLWDGYYNGYYEYDIDELMDYCKKNCGFTFEYNEEDYLNMLAELDKHNVGDDFKKAYIELHKESPREKDVKKAFDKWLRDYLMGLDWEERRDFFYEHLKADVCMDNVELDYKVMIPQAIIEMAKQPA